MGHVIGTFRRAIDDATLIDDFIDWREAGTFAADVDEVVDSLAELLKPNSAPVLVELTEHAIARLERSLEQIDDSDGQVGDIVHRLGELHLKACLMARPEPVGLAERLFRLEMTQAFDMCSFDAARYGLALGKAGLRRYRELVESEWRKFKPRDSADRYDRRRFRITRIMEQLAEASGDVEELVAIKARDLSSSYRYLNIAETWAKARQPGKALEWAERGLKAFPERPDNRLRDFLAGAYLKRGRNDEALQLTWIQFEEDPGLELYKKLHGVAEKLGVWPAQRSRALSLVEDLAKRTATGTNKWKPKRSAPDQSVRVEIALWEQDFDAAWAVVRDGTCNHHLLIALAGKLEKSRPGHAVSLYRRVIPAIVEHTNNAAYAEAIGLIRKIARLMKAQDEARDFADYLVQLRVHFKPKRNFIKLLDREWRTGPKI